MSRGLAITTADSPWISASTPPKEEKWVDVIYSDPKTGEDVYTIGIYRRYEDSLFEGDWDHLPRIWDVFDFDVEMVAECPYVKFWREHIGR